jgi:hypothetical protein
MNSKHERESSGGENTWVFIWGMTPNVVGHVAIQIGGEKPGDPTGVYKSVHPKLPVFGPLIVYPFPMHTATTLQEDSQSEGKARRLEDGLQQAPDAIFHTKALDTTLMKVTAEQNSLNNEGKYQLIPGIQPWYFFNRAAEDVTYQPIERIEYPLMRKARPLKAFNCATFVGEVLKSGGVTLQESRFPWKMSPNSIWSQLSKNHNFSRVV